MLALAVARYLDSLDMVILNEGDTGGDCFVGAMPNDPDIAVSIVPTGGRQQPTTNPTNLPLIQIRARGVKHDPVAPFERAQAITDALACLDGTHLDPDGPDEVWVIGVDPIQSEPAPLGADENGRHEYVVNFEFRTHHPTIHRPALA